MQGERGASKRQKGAERELKAPRMEPKGSNTWGSWPATMKGPKLTPQTATTAAPSTTNLWNAFGPLQSRQLKQLIYPSFAC